jgi:dienelactone hydrolase
MGIVVGFIPWIVYWILVGNVPFTLAVTIAFGITLLIQIALRMRKQPAHTLDVGNLIVFALLVAAAYLAPQDVLERWLQPLSSLGLLLIALGGLLIGRPFVREYAVASVDAETAKTSGFKTITNAMTWMWVGAFAIMFVSSLIPPILDGDATILDLDDPLSILCYWVIPYTVMGIAGTISAVFPPWFDRKSAEVDQRSAVIPVIAPQAPPPPDVDGLTITAPADTRSDEGFSITVNGGKAGSTIEVTTSGDDLFGRAWRSRAAFTVPADGVLDLSAIAPHGVDGQDPDWTAADRTAPIWAMRFDDDDATPELFVPPAEPWQLTIEASGVGAVGSTQSGAASQPVSGRRTVLRRTGAVGLRYEPTEINGLPGMLVTPAGDAPSSGWPAVAVFGGSEGGFESQLSNAAVLASRGYAALAQAWISEADAAVTVSEVPLERFAAALGFLAEHGAVDDGRVSAMGISRGAEGLLAAVSRGLGPRLNAMVLISPSCVTWQALGSSGEVPDTASWKAGGQPVPWVPLTSGVLMRQIIRNAWTVGRDIAKRRPSLLRLRPAYEASLTAAGLLDRRGMPVPEVPVHDGATIPGIGGTGRKVGPPPAGSVLDAAAVRCRMLLIAGGDDQLWPSVAMAQVLAAQRSAAGLDQDDQLISYDGAGHLIRLGLLPTDAPWTNGIAFGGSREGLAHAQADATERVTAFLGARVTATG